MRNKGFHRSQFLFAMLLFAVIFANAVPASADYHLLKKVVLGGEGFWDYLTVDVPNRHVFISRSTHVMVVDADTYAVVGDIPDTKGVHGIAIATDLGRGYTSNGGSNTVTIFDLKSFKVLGTAPTGEGPDAIVYDPASHRVFTMNGHGQSATAIDGATGTVAGTFPLGGRPEFATADGAGHVYANLEDKSMVVAIDSSALKVLNTWPLAPGDSPSGMAIDAAHRRLFCGCHNKMMAIMDADSGKVVASPAIGQGVDANGFDPGTELAFSSNGDGTLTVVHEDSPDKFTVVGNVSTQRGARTMALDTKTHNVFLVTAEFGPTPAPTADQPRPRPSMVPNSFTLLVYGN
ncbi:MAG TPA: YncE family protein [Terriglobia bacterium]|nr:YncE family protein [Terriglobia bacterium]